MEYDSWISNRDAARIGRTAKQAAKSNHHRFRVGATIWKGGSLLGSGINVVRGGPDVPEGRFSVHAEVSCLNDCLTPKGATLYVVRLDANDSFVNSEPCESCMTRIEKAELSRVVYIGLYGHTKDYRL